MGRILAAILVLIAAAAWPSPAPAENLVDRILMADSFTISYANLPDGAGLPALPVNPPQFGTPHVTADGRLLVTDGVGPGSRIQVGELMPDGSRRPITVIDQPPGTDYQQAIDLTSDSRGRLYLVVQAVKQEPFARAKRLIEIDPETGAQLGAKPLPDHIFYFATAPQGLWVLDSDQVRSFDPDTLAYGPPVVELPHSASNIETDSSGRLWFLRQPACIPEDFCNSVESVDLETGVVVAAPEAMYTQTQLLDMTIERRCSNSATIRCLQGGRFKAEISFADYAGAEGSARAAEARSRNTGIFWFFHPDNWELMVKVLDGCAINGNYWVYSSASTDVQYAMTVTDTHTGAQKRYTNPLGQPAKTVADIAAFPCSP
jgi:hypothetical protein